jgi:hypothetical protein
MDCPEFDTALRQSMGHFDPLKALFDSPKLVQIFLLGSLFCSKLTRYFTSEIFSKSLEYKLIRRNIDIGALNRGKKFQCILVIWGKFYEDI